MDDHKFFIDFFGEHANDEHCCAFCGATKDLTTIGSTVYARTACPNLARRGRQRTQRILRKRKLADSNPYYAP